MTNIRRKTFFSLSPFLAGPISSANSLLDCLTSSSLSSRHFKHLFDYSIVQHSLRMPVLLPLLFLLFNFTLKLNHFICLYFFSYFFMDVIISYKTIFLYSIKQFLSFFISFYLLTFYFSIFILNILTLNHLFCYFSLFP